MFGRRLFGDRRGVSLSGDRWPGAAAAEGGPPHGNHEHQTGPGAQNLCSDQHAEKLVAHRALRPPSQAAPGQTGLTQDLWTVVPTG